MSKAVLFIGTSFLGAIKQGWEASAIGKDWRATFLGMDAPSFARNLAIAGWDVAGGCLNFNADFECFLSGEDFIPERPSGNKTFPGAQKSKGDLSLDLVKYQAIVFVDMFHRFGIPLGMEAGGWTLKGTPVSSSMLRELRLQGFNGWISLTNHPKHGDVPWQEVKCLLSEVAREASGARCYLISAPRPPQGNVDAVSRYGGINEAKTCFNNTEDFYAESMAELGIEYLRQPEEVLDADRCFTNPHFSRGTLPSNPAKLDMHMNQAYGELMVHKLLTVL